MQGVVPLRRAVRHLSSSLLHFQRHRHLPLSPFSIAPKPSFSLFSPFSKQPLLSLATISTSSFINNNNAHHSSINSSTKYDYDEAIDNSHDPNSCDRRDVDEFGEEGESGHTPVRGFDGRTSNQLRVTDAYKAIELALDSVVKIFTVTSSPNYFLPWQNKSQRETMGSGFVISGRRILTNAHMVADYTFVLVRKHGSSTKYRAEFQAVGHECDLAILVVDSEEFWQGMNHLELGDIPFLQEAVVVVGYPQGGDNISVTKGVVSRVEPTQYVHGASQLLAIQIDAAINPGNSGGPAIIGDKVAGLAFQNLSGAENIGYIIPVPVIKHFISGVEERGKYVGFCSLGLSCQAMENMQLREHFGMKPGMTGVLVSKINPLSDAHKILKKDDVILAFDGVPIANDGTVPFRNRERITFDHLVSMKKPNEKAELRVLRDRKECNFVINVHPLQTLVPVHQLISFRVTTYLLA